MTARSPQPSRGVLGLLVLLAGAGACGSPTGPDPDDQDLPPQPVLVSPIGGAQVATDSPAFLVRNARGFNGGQAQYTFLVTTVSGLRELASTTVAAGRGTTSATFPAPLPRGLGLKWSVTARSGAAQVSSPAETFRLPPVDCRPPGTGFAQGVVDLFLPACERSPNIYTDPQEVLGPPNAAGFGPFNFTGFLSLAEKGYVSVDMEACAADGPGDDLRVFQVAGSEPVSLYAAGSPGGPFLLLEARKTCGTRVPGSRLVRFCDFDLAQAEVEEARYFRVEDGEHFPCALADTPSEGADIDALQLLNLRP